MARPQVANARSLAVGPTGNFDRSPCGTGTSARVAALYARQELDINERFKVASVNDSHFEARVIEETSVGDFKAIVPEITATAFITGHHQFVLDPDDPLKDGFLI